MSTLILNHRIIKVLYLGIHLAKLEEYKGRNGNPNASPSPLS